MNRPAQELVWRGRLHLGDEPGIYGDACYAGLGVDLPLTLRRFPDPRGDETVTLVVEAEGVRTYPGYPGSTVSLVHYAETATPGHWRERVLAERRLAGDATAIAVDLAPVASPSGHPLYLSPRLRMDTEVAPGLYADFVAVALKLHSAAYYASFGFQAPG